MHDYVTLFMFMVRHCSYTAYPVVDSGESILSTICISVPFILSYVIVEQLIS